MLVLVVAVAVSVTGVVLLSSPPSPSGTVRSGGGLRHRLVAVLAALRGVPRLSRRGGTAAVPAWAMGSVVVGPVRVALVRTCNIHAEDENEKEERKKGGVY